MKENKLVLLVLTEDEEVLITSLEDYNEDEGSEYIEDFSMEVSIENAKSYGNGNEEWENTLDKYSDCKLFEIECGWGESSMILVKRD